jgi:hypothetical protein
MEKNFSGLSGKIAKNAVSAWKTGKGSTLERNQVFVFLPRTNDLGTQKEAAAFRKMRGFFLYIIHLE